ncbi:MAG: BON domain-containing protein [Burkholderiaceae bacterium]|nr:BON domain-containing protein [Burkholderiaceae bacterium]
MKVFETRLTEKQLSRWLASLLVASSVLLCAAVVLARSNDPASLVVQYAQGAENPPAVSLPPTNPASPTAPPALTPATEDPPAPRTPAEVAIDQAIAERVRVALTNDHQTRAQPIDILVTRGIANLSGNVSTEAVAHRALSIARSTGGVRAVQDAMKVEDTPAVRRLR